MKLATTTGDFSAYTNNQLEAMEYIARAGFKYMDYSIGIDYANQSGILPMGNFREICKKIC